MWSRTQVVSGLSRFAATRALGIGQTAVAGLLGETVKSGKRNADRETVSGWRREWLLLLEQVSKRSRSAAIKLNPKLYNRLRRHDAEWVFTESRNKVPPRHNRSRKDWDAEDRSLVERIRSAAKDIRESVPLMRASREKMFKIAEISRFRWRYKDRFPMCAAALLELEESVEEFGERRLWTAVTVAAQQGEPLYPWKLRKIAGANKRDLGPRLTGLIAELTSSARSNVCETQE